MISQTNHTQATIEFHRFLQHIERPVPADPAVHVVLDSYASHKTEKIRKWFLRHPRYTLHFTPPQFVAEPGGTLVRSIIATSSQARLSLQRA